MKSVFIGIAGWGLSRENAEYFPQEGSHLERYARTFNAVEVNSSFYKPHLPKTFKRWGESVPSNFRYSVKLSKIVTHETRLEISKGELRDIVSPILELGDKLGCILAQFPPSLAFDADLAEDFLSNMRELCPAPVVVEPRHITWVSQKAARLFRNYEIDKVQADPEPCPDLANLFPTNRIHYLRLHGTPEKYRSSYSSEFLKDLAHKVSKEFTDKPSWVIFDNTALGKAIPNAVDLGRRVQPSL